ncbi:pyruvate dehydrogenase (acetyl-transferring) E1 component subunit alpha [Ktedonosporobacter rubrisoli]|uniref:Pyruvate dehydrogenase E1 component subunit alpha n=1 Tax=Ktedonosporobacter rubrisoli TaxID=2509675 RepID=A0A4P6JZ62_KTERU|nr:pyruvate dehydrogenase (acetyl-transferring) E1 component subunit alpha [Ktedonosporobacter rubrisoli]QBD81168.1 pyruvate dehydrogenase (acetyl-transferring) E1 component subunit alpha [Ktedonosporobacter rubrisoli]
MAISNATLAELTRTQLVEMHYKMALLRRFEEKSAEEYTRGKIGGFMHLYIGQEAVGVGSIAALRPSDKIMCTYREHGHALAKGMEPGQVMAELFGKITGCSKGKGGSMHMWSNELGILGGQAIVGAHLPIAAGVALAAQYRGEDTVIVCYFGDGAVDEGAFHESLNLASIWKLPVVYICENNQYSMGMAVEKAWAVDSLLPRAAAHNIGGEQVDGMNILAVYEATKRAVEHARSGQGPALLEAKTYRFRAHSMTDPAYYRTREEEREWRSSRDPIAIFEKTLLENGIATQAEFDANDERAIQVAEEAAEFAENSSFPSLDELYTDVMADNSTALAYRYERK